VTRYAVLLRGVNVGRARRIAMQDLRELLEDLGYTRVGTVLNSGNAVLAAAETVPGRVAAAAAAAIRTRTGLSVPVVAVPAAQLDAIVAACPLASVATDPARHLVGFVPTAEHLAAATPLLDRDWAPEFLALGPGAAYLWCAAGIVRSPLLAALSRATSDAVTTRNWSTVLRLQTALGGLPDAP